MTRCTSCHAEFIQDASSDNLRAGFPYCNNCLGHTVLHGYGTAGREWRLGWTMQDYWDNGRVPPGVVTQAARSES